MSLALPSSYSSNLGTVIDTMPIHPESKKSWIRVLPALPNPSELLRKMKPTVQIDPYVGSAGVVGLDKATFKNFLSQKEFVLVLFYDPSEERCVWSKEQLSKAAEVKLRPGQAFAAVDLSKSPELCSAERVDCVPYFKLYCKGRSVCSIREHQEFSANAMLKFLDHADVISSPTQAADQQEKSFCSALLAIVENLPPKPQWQLVKRSG